MDREVKKRGGMSVVSASDKLHLIPCRFLDQKDWKEIQSVKYSSCKQEDHNSTPRTHVTNKMAAQ